MTPSLGPLVQSYFIDHLPVQKGLRVGSIRSYRDTIRLFLCFVSGQRRSSISSVTLDDLTFERVLAFLKHLEQERRNSVRTRNQRRAALNTFFAYVAVRVPEMLAACQQVAAIPVKRTSLPDTHYLEREEVTALFRALPRDSRFALRDRTLLLFLYNTGARVQEAADLRIEHLELEPPAKVRLHGKGVGGGENPRINGAESVPESRSSSHRAALGSGGPAVTGNQPSLLMVKDGCPATLCKRWPTAPAFGGCRR